MMNFIQFVAFPSREDAIIEKNVAKMRATGSGSLGLYYNKKCHMTFPNETMTSNEEFDWCSNIANRNQGEMPWITFNLPGQKMKLTGFSVRNGCCRHLCCCDEDGKVVDYGCCCVLYTFSLQGSNDNQTWKTIHRVEKANDFWGCMFNTYEFAHETEGFNFIRLVQEDPYPGCPFCMQVNQVELYGKTMTSDYFLGDDIEDNDESVSIIGKIRKDEE